VVVACKSLLSFDDLLKLWQESLPELGIWLLTFCTTITLGIQDGILIGMSASLAWFIMGMVLTGPLILAPLRSRRSVFGAMLPTSSSSNTGGLFSNSNAEARIVERIVVVGFSGPLFYGNSGRLYDFLALCSEKRPSYTDEREANVEVLHVNNYDRSSTSSVPVDIQADVVDVDDVLQNDENDIE